MCAKSKSAAVIFAGLEPGAPQRHIEGYPTSYIRFILHPNEARLCSSAVEMELAPIELELAISLRPHTPF